MSRVDSTHPFDVPVIDLRPFLKTQYPRHAAKALAREEGCSIGTAKRILSTGHAPTSRLLRRLERFDAWASSAIDHLERLRSEAREARHAASGGVVVEHHRVGRHGLATRAALDREDALTSRAQTA